MTRGILKVFRSLSRPRDDELENETPQEAGDERSDSVTRSRKIAGRMSADAEHEGEDDHDEEFDEDEEEAGEHEDVGKE